MSSQLLYCFALVAYPVIEIEFMLIIEKACATSPDDQYIAF
jgi:hypothetical protein